MTALSHLGFALLTEGFWLGMMLRALAGIGWAGTYMTGLKALADNLRSSAPTKQASLTAARGARPNYPPDRRCSCRSEPARRS
jgi:hypothetical protein